MKRVYFVRHGLSSGNADDVWHSLYDPDPLVDQGKDQSLLLAERCVKLPIDVIISSTIERAKTTADIVSGVIKKPVELSDLFIERRRPSNQIGFLKDSPESRFIGTTILENFHIENYRFSDEENFEDLKTRAHQALLFLEKRPEADILVITHDFFLRIILAYVTFGDSLNGDECRQFIKVFCMKNTGLTIMVFDDIQKPVATSAWRVYTWNDFSHLQI